ncbi:MAG: hypothetical protein K940chlam3_00749 [Chlamydiae bacterium]|nr:hypothetical protein [Chlamydiota bacterium]
MSKIKYLPVLICLVFICVSCGRDNSDKRYASLPSDQREEVIDIDKQIKELQKEMEINLRKFQKEELEAQKEVFDEFKEFSESVKEGQQFQDRANQIREIIIELQQKKMHILENQFPQK